MDACINCACPSDETPIMRAGPDGLRSLCNACGLHYKKTGSMRSVHHLQHCGRNAKRRKVDLARQQKLLENPKPISTTGTASTTMGTANSGQQGLLNHQQSLPSSTSLPHCDDNDDDVGLPQFPHNNNNNRGGLGDGLFTNRGMHSDARPFPKIEIVDFDSLDTWSIGQTFSLSSDPFERYLAESLLLP